MHRRGREVEGSEAVAALLLAVVTLAWHGCVLACLSTLGEVGGACRGWRRRRAKVTSLTFAAVTVTDRVASGRERVVRAPR